MDKRISTEGDTLTSAIQLASQELGVSFEQVRYSFDHEHFKNSLGKGKAVDTVKIQAWVATEEEMEDAKLKQKSAPEKKSHPVAEAAKEWLSELMTSMNIPVEIDYTVKSEDSHIVMLINSEKGGRIVGRKGFSLQQFKHLLNEVMNKSDACLEDSWNFSIDVLRNDSRDRDGRDRRRRDDSPRRRKLGEQDVSKLKRLAKKLASQVIEQKQSVVIGKVFNNFERRIIHQTITDFNGVDTESFDDNGVRRIRLVYLSEVDESENDSQD